MGHLQQPPLFFLGIRALGIGLLLGPLLKHRRLELGRANQVLHLKTVQHMVHDVLLFFALCYRHSSAVVASASNRDWMGSGCASLMRSNTSAVMSHGSVPYNTPSPLNPQFKMKSMPSS